MRMLPFDPTASSGSQGRREDMAGANDRRRRNRLTPGAEALEVRDCPSGLTPHAGAADSAEARVAARHAEVREAHRAAPAKKVTRQAAQVLYVAPTGSLALSAGKTAAHPLGSLVLALKRAKSGATIILAPGTYNYSPTPVRAASISGKSDITVLGASGQRSVLAAADSDAIKVVSSSNITIENVWFDSAGMGLAVVGSSVNVVNIKTDGSNTDGVVVTGYGGQTATLDATSSQFDAVRTGDGMDVQGGASVTINGCTFSDNGTAGGALSGGSGLSVEGNSQVNIANSQFSGNLNTNLVAYGQAQVTAQGSTFSGSQKGDGAIFSGQALVDLTGNTFASNGTVVGYASGFNGVEFYSGFGGTANISGNTFLDNTANGIYVGGSAQAVQITGNVFNGNLVGLNMDASVAPINAVVQGNTFTVALGASDMDQGLVASGSGVTATIGGSGSLANVFENYGYQDSIRQYHVGGSAGSTIGCPNLSIQTNSFLIGGRPVDSAYAILPC